MPLEQKLVRIYQVSKYDRQQSQGVWSVENNDSKWAFGVSFY